MNKISIRQKQVLNLLTEEFESISGVSARLKISKNRVYKIAQNLKKKGLLIRLKSGGYIKGGVTKGVTSVSCGKFETSVSCGTSHKIRLHGLRFRVKIIDSGGQVFNNDFVDFGDYSVYFYPSSVVLMVKKSFFGFSPLDALGDASDYLDFCLCRLENKFNLVLKKSGVNNIVNSSGHYSEIKNGVAYRMKKHKFQVRDKGGKVWLIIDNSFNLHELETIGKTAFDDSEVLKPFLNDLRDFPDIPLRSQHYKITESLIKAVENIGNLSIKNKSDLNVLFKSFDNLLKPFNNLGGNVDNLGDLSSIPEYIG